MSVTTEPHAAPGPDAPQASSRRALALIAAVVLVAALATGVVVWLHRGPATAPYQDTTASGSLTLCKDGKPVTSGSLSDVAWVDDVVGSTSIPATAQDASATLFAYQPRQGIGPSEWTGLQLTASGSAPTSQQPDVVLRSGDTTLAQFVNGYPATWDGWIQLRLVEGSPTTGAIGYDAVDLKIDGNTWQAVGAGHATCPS